MTNDDHPTLYGSERQLFCLLKSPQLRNSPVLQKLLKFIVYETLEGRGGALNAGKIARRVFGRGNGISSKRDGIVRDSVRRLRIALALHYANRGRNEDVILRLTLGRYTPTFSYRMADGRVDHSQPLMLMDAYNTHVTRQTHKEALLSITQALQTNPESVELQVAYAELLIDSFTLGFGGSGESIEKARTAVENADSREPLHGSWECWPKRPRVGFGFSDTAFRIFILMASRRLKSDRFFTEDYNSRVYTPEGMRWIAENDMSAVLLRHYPELAPALRGIKNAFAPWNPLPLGRKVARAPGHRDLLAERRSTAGPVDQQVLP